jgi:exosortase C (VPDSG-CTERM-specific)
MKRYRSFGIFAGALTLSFAPFLISLVRFALNSALFSYILLVPFISAYFIWTRRHKLDAVNGGVRWPAAVAIAVGAWLLWLSTGQASSISALCCQMAAYCCFLWGGGIFFLRTHLMRTIAFPAIFLIFIAPIPPSIVDMMEVGLQHGSAELAYQFISWSGIPVLREGFDFHLPRITVSVAPQCSGIRSSLALFLCSLVAGQLFLRSTWARCCLALFVIPLGIARNAFRILVISYLSVRVDTSYAHSIIHTQGGPLFFMLSLIPFGLVLFLLRKK